MCIEWSNSEESGLPSMGKARLLVATQGITLLEVLVGMAIISLYATAAMPALLTMNHIAQVARIMTTAKEVVDRNVEAASAVPFTSSTVPAILAVTGSSVQCSDYPSGASNPISLLPDSAGASIVTGTLSKSVSLWNTTDATDNANTRIVTFTMTYSLFRRQMTYQATTIRAPDL